jgi:hypothetical protein
MSSIRALFEPTRNLDRRIEKVISFDNAENEQLRREITEYVVTNSIESNFERLLNHFDYGLSGAGGETGVWTSGFYGSGKSSFTKYLGFALDPTRQVDGKPFLEWLQNQLHSKPLRAQLGALAKRYPCTVIMLDLASAQIAGATMAEISSVLYWTVMQWAGYSKDKKVACLQLMLERDGKWNAFEKRIKELAKGRPWKEIQNQPLVAQQFASKLACELYHDIFPTTDAFQKMRLDEAEKENERVKEMLELIRRKSGKENVIFILDEVGAYISSRDDLINNLDGLAKNIKMLGGGKAWIIATAQQTLTEDDPRAQMNTGKLFKLIDRFPIPIDLEASDIKEICYRRLLGKSGDGDKKLAAVFDAHGQALRHHTQLQGTRFYKADLDKKVFCDLYPFLPQHFDILLSLLGRLAKTSGGVGLRSAIKVIQDVLVDQSGLRPGQKLLADQAIGTLATTVVFYDTLRRDIQRSFKHVVEGVERVEKIYGADDIHTRVAKSIAVLQVLDDFPVNRENIAALLHPSADAASLANEVKTAVDDLLNEPAAHLSEIDGRLRFMSEAVAELETERLKIHAGPRDTRLVLHEKLKEIFTPAPSIRLKNTRTVTTGLKVAVGSMVVSLDGEKEPVQTVMEFVPSTNYDKRKEERIVDSNQRANLNTIYLQAREDAEIENLLAEIVRCRGIANQYRNKSVEKEVADYLSGQIQRADTLSGSLEKLLKELLVAGSFVFRGQPVAVSELNPDLLPAASKHLEQAAETVFEKYVEAPIQAESSLAEKFLTTENLSHIASKDDPLGLVKKAGGKATVDNGHRALVSIKDYLDKHGQVDGRKLLDDFYAAPCGWSKDTTRYLISALLVAGEVKLRIAGADVTVRGDAATEALKNNNSFNKIGVSLRDSKPSPDAMLRASERLLTLTGENLMPLEAEISKAVTKHFPEFQRDYAPLAHQLKACGLNGIDRAENIQDSITEMLRGDASDATTWLGGEVCALFDDLQWAGSVKKAFDNGIDAVIETLRRHLAEIAALPAVGAPGQLMTNTEQVRVEVTEFLKREDFYNFLPDLKNRLTSLEVTVKTAVNALAAEQETLLRTETTAIQSSSDWTRLGQDDQNAFSVQLDKLKVETTPDLDGLKKLMGHQYALTTQLERIKTRVREAAKAKPTPVEAMREEFAEVTITLPAELTSPDQLDQLIAEIEKLKPKFQQYVRIKLKWN